MQFLLTEGDKYWQEVENYIAGHSQAQFSHAVCPECYAREVKPRLEEIEDD